MVLVKISAQVVKHVIIVNIAASRTYQPKGPLHGVTPHRQVHDQQLSVITKAVCQIAIAEKMKNVMGVAMLLVLVWTKMKI